MRIINFSNIPKLPPIIAETKHETNGAHPVFNLANSRMVKERDTPALAPIKVLPQNIAKSETAKTAETANRMIFIINY